VAQHPDKKEIDGCDGLVTRQGEVGMAARTGTIAFDYDDVLKLAAFFNKVPEPRQAKNRVHIDLVDPDPDVVDKLGRIGATVIGKHQIRGHRWTVLQDPEGNEFCIAAKSFTGFG
jgi:Glyoxalase-like domain